jgi:hypothetical protein
MEEKIIIFLAPRSSCVAAPVPFVIATTPRWTPPPSVTYKRCTTTTKTLGTYFLSLSLSSHFSGGSLKP